MHFQILTPVALAALAICAPYSTPDHGSVYGLISGIVRREEAANRVYHSHDYKRSSPAPRIFETYKPEIEDAPVTHDYEAVYGSGEQNEKRSSPAPRIFETYKPEIEDAPVTHDYEAVYGSAEKEKRSSPAPRIFETYKPEVEDAPITHDYEAVYGSDE